MPEVINDDELEDLDYIVLENLKKGKMLPVIEPLIKSETKTIHYDILNIRELAKELNQLYSKNATKEEFFKVIMKRRIKVDDDIHNFMNKIENLPNEELVEVIDRKNKGNEIIVKFRKVSTEKKKQLVKSITKKLIKKISKEQLTELFEQAINKLNDLKVLKKVDKALKKKKPKLEGSRGCYKLMIEDTDLFVVG